jgi:hypothetical protein
MSSSQADRVAPLARDVWVSNDTLTVELVDGRVLAVPLNWYPRLNHGSDSERSNWQLIAGGIGIHWPDLDEDISVEGLLAGLPSNESETSIQRWLTSRPRTG